MLNPKAFQTPNALDPGEAPPSRPSRVVRTSNNTRSVEIPTVQEVRQNAARLLADDDTEKTNTFPFDKDDSADRNNDQLPSVEEARLYAGRILNAKSTRDLSPETMERERLTVNKSVPVNFPSRGGRRYGRCLWISISLILVGLIFAVAALAVENVHHRGSVPTRQAPQTPDNRPEPYIPDEPPSPRLLSAISFLVTNGISEEETLQTRQSPQYKAAYWIANADTLEYPVPMDTDFSAEAFIQRYVLAVFYYATGGTDWTKQHKFLSGEHECGWFGREKLKSGEEYALGVECNEQLEVESILIPRNELRGGLPDELAHLKALTFLDLNRNEILGRIPERFEMLEKLVFLDVRYNLVSGTIPVWLGTAMPNLQVLALSNNLMGGALPESLSNARRLHTLALDDNDFEGSLDPIQSLIALKYLYLDNNEFRHTLSDQTFADLGDLVHLDLSGNQLSANNVPPHFFAHARMKVLDLHDNNLVGSLPENIPQNDALEFLSLQDNDLQGEIPAAIQNLRSLTHLDVTGNELEGTIPAFLGTMVSLTYLFLSENPFIPGPIPNSFVSLANLRELSLAETMRTGTIPKWVGALDRLILVDFSKNQLEGRIPEELWQPAGLSFVLLNRNKLSGDVPSGLTMLPNLNMLLLDRNDIRDDFTEACNNGLELQFFVSDCQGPDREVTCPCCTSCCNDSDNKCYDDLLYGNIDPKWEHNYTRSSYSFSPKILEA